LVTVAVEDIPQRTSLQSVVGHSESKNVAERSAVDATQRPSHLQQQHRRRHLVDRPANTGQCICVFVNMSLGASLQCFDTVGWASGIASGL